MAQNKHQVFITGGTGYIGSRLIPKLLARGHSVRALVRSGSEKKLLSGCEAVTGDALSGGSYADKVPPCAADNMYKDLTSALNLAGEVGACLPAASIAREMLRAVKIQGNGAMDSASVVTVIERLANTVVKARG